MRLSVSSEHNLQPAIAAGKIRVEPHLPRREGFPRQGQRRCAASLFNFKQQAFLDFVLAQYVTVGVSELGAEKLGPLLKLKYDAIADAIDDLGEPERIREVFTGFQKYLYQEAV